MNRKYYSDNAYEAPEQQETANGALPLTYDEADVFGNEEGHQVCFHTC